MKKTDLILTENKSNTWLHLEAGRIRIDYILYRVRDWEIEGEADGRSVSCRAMLEQTVQDRTDEIAVVCTKCLATLLYNVMLRLK